MVETGFVYPKIKLGGVNDFTKLSRTLCAVLFDGPVGEQTWPEDGKVGPPLKALGLEEIHLLQKVQEIIRASPGKAESLFEKFLQILKEENRDDLICNH